MDNRIGVIMSKCGIEKLYNQIRAEQKSKYEGRTKEDYLVRGENNKRLRWSITMAIVIAHYIRIFYIERGYYMHTSAILLVLGQRIHSYIFDHTVSILEASDWASSHGSVSRYQSRISFYFRDQLPSHDFYALVHRILEFKLWYFTTKLFLYAFLLTWYSLLKCSFYDQGALSLTILCQCCWFAVSMAQKPAVVTYTDQ